LPSIRVRVPATTANLGPGFDALGLALDLWNEAEFSVPGEMDPARASSGDLPPGPLPVDLPPSPLPAGRGGRGTMVEISGEGAGRLPTDAKNLIVRSAKFLYERAKRPFPRELHIRCTNRIPLGSGLGSSAAAVVSGLLGANGLLGKPYSALDVLGMAAEIEGHPDNAAAAVLGGLAVVVSVTGEIVARKIEIHALDVAVAVPDFNLPTHAARAALPGQVSLPDAVFNLGRTALVVEALRSGDLDLLGKVMFDRLHQPFRLPLIPGAEAAMKAALQAGAAVAVLSGAGPGVAAFGRGDMAPVAEAMRLAFEAAGLRARAWVLAATSQGAAIL
jgi:homoserine kinase